jgi:hypothetical protein
LLTEFAFESPRDFAVLHSIRLFAVVALVVCPHIVAAQEEAATDEETRAKVAFELVSKAADDFDIETRTATPAKLKRVETPLLRWSNPEAGSVHGAVFVWTVNDRPQLVASVFKWFSPQTALHAEVHSLSEQPLVAKRGTQTAWHTGDQGINFQRLEGAPAPADSPVRRLPQMRALLREMVASENTRDKQKIDLRLMEKPLHRYQAPKEGVVDGALFAFARATDPEVMVLIEAKQNGGDTFWQITFARMNSCAMNVKQGDKTLYEVDELPWGVVFGGKEVYNIVDIKDGKE